MASYQCADNTNTDPDFESVRMTSIVEMRRTLHRYIPGLTVEGNGDLSVMEELSTLVGEALDHFNRSDGSDPLWSGERLNLLKRLISINPDVLSFPPDCELPIHRAVCCDDPCVDIVEFFLESAPHTAGSLDEYGMSPIDVLATQMIAKEERWKYSRERRNNSGNISFDTNWECVRLLIYHTTSLPKSLPTLHICMAASTSGLPGYIPAKAIETFPGEAHVMDDLGNSALHWIARQEGSEEEDDLLHDILMLNPGASRKQNWNGCLPLDLAIASGRTWREGVGALVEANPTSMRIRRRHGVPVLVKLLNRASLDTTFAILRECSEELAFETQGEADD